MIDEKFLSELEALESNAQRGPWRWHQCYESRGIHWALVGERHEDEGLVVSHHLVSLSSGPAHGSMGFLDDADVKIVPAARNALPLLLAEVRRLQLQVSELKGELRNAQQQEEPASDVPCNYCENGELWTECCSGAEGCPCQGRQISMGTCRVCNGTGIRSIYADVQANIQAIRGAISPAGYIGNPYGKSR